MLFALIVGRTPWSAADARVGFLRLDELIALAKRGSGGPARTWGPPHNSCRIPSFEQSCPPWPIPFLPLRTRPVVPFLL